MHFKHFGFIYVHINKTLNLLQPAVLVCCHDVSALFSANGSSVQHWVHCASFRVVHGWSRRAERWALVLSALHEASRGSAGGSSTVFWATPSQQSQQGCLHCEEYYWLCLWLMSRITTFELLLVSKFNMLSLYRLFVGTWRCWGTAALLYGGLNAAMLPIAGFYTWCMMCIWISLRYWSDWS